LGDVLLKVENLTLPRKGGGYLLDHVSFELREGEILGFYGLMGAGRSDLVDCLAGARPQATGKIWIDSKPVTARTISERIASGFVLVPEDRQRYGLVQTLSVMDNMLLASLRRFFNGVFLSSAKQNQSIHRMITELAIKVANAQNPISSLSGGNQQKIVVAKSLLTQPKVLLMDEPTRGIDVGAKEEIFEIARRLAAQGLGIIFVSTELKEIMAIAVRIIVMSKGRITKELGRAVATQQTLVEASAIGYERNLINNG
jgi:erythritol transport system ATP-binding protein